MKHPPVIEDEQLPRLEPLLPARRLADRAVEGSVRVIVLGNLRGV